MWLRLLLPTMTVLLFRKPRNDHALIQTENVVTKRKKEPAHFYCGPHGEGSSAQWFRSTMQSTRKRPSGRSG